MASAVPSTMGTLIASGLLSAGKAITGKKEGIRLAYEASLQGLEETMNMISQHGKAACFREKTIGKKDPGAAVGMLIFKALHDYVCNK